MVSTMMSSPKSLRRRTQRRTSSTSSPSAPASPALESSPPSVGGDLSSKRHNRKDRHSTSESGSDFEQQESPTAPKMSHYQPTSPSSPSLAVDVTPALNQRSRDDFTSSPTSDHPTPRSVYLTTTTTGVTTSSTQSSAPSSQPKQNVALKMCKRLLFLIGLIYSLARTIGIALQNVYHIPFYLFCMWVIFLPVFITHRLSFYRIENKLYNLCLYTVGSWSWLGGLRVIECGDDIYNLIPSMSAVTSARARCTSNNNHQRDDEQSDSSDQTTLSGVQERRPRTPSPPNHHQDHLNSNLIQVEDTNTPNTPQHQPMDSAIVNMTDTMSPIVPNGISSSDTQTTILSHDLESASSCQKVKQEMKPKVLMMANHQSTADVPLMFQALVSRAHYIMLWVMDYQFRYTNFGIVSSSHGDFFITPKTFVKSELTKHCSKFPDKDLVILFPEGGFRYKREESSNRFAQKQGWPSLNHLTWPRHGAFMDLMEGGLPFGHIVDLTILYKSQIHTPSILDILGGRNPQPIYFHYRVFEVDPDIAYNEKWLNDRWQEKESLMKSYYEDPDKFLEQLHPTMRPVKMSYLHILMTQAFYLIGSYLMVTLCVFLFKYLKETLFDVHH